MIDKNLNRIKVVLAEKNINGKVIAEKNWSGSIDLLQVGN